MLDLGDCGWGSALSASMEEPPLEMTLTHVSDTIHADSLTLFALNIEIILADVTKPEKWKSLT